MSRRIGWKLSDETKAKMSASKTGAGNPRWQEEPTYEAIHGWLRRHYPRTGRCVRCGSTKHVHLASLLHDERGEPIYVRDVSMYAELCAKHHRRLDCYWKRRAREAAA